MKKVSETYDVSKGLQQRFKEAEDGLAKAAVSSVEAILISILVDKALEGEDQKRKVSVQYDKLTRYGKAWKVDLKARLHPRIQRDANNKLIHP